MLILTYHSIDASGSILSVSPHQFAEQMTCLANLGFQGISLRTAVAYRDVEGRWPKQGVVLTFDDGYVNFYDSALPVLKQHEFTATVFVLNDLMGGYNQWGAPLELLGRQRLISWEQAVELAAMDIELGSHTRTHPDLRQLNPEEMVQEIVASRDDLAAHVGQAVESFAYPFGHVSPMALAMVQQKFRAGCTTVLKRVGDEPLHRLPRIDMYYMQSLRNFKRLLNGELGFYLSLRRWGRVLRHGRVGA